MRSLALLTFGCVSVYAQFYTVPQPGAEYLSNTTLVPISTANAATLTTPTPLTASGQSVSFSTSLTAFNAGIGAGIFNPWGASPNVELVSLKILASGVNQTALTIDVATPSTTFGFEMAAVNRCNNLPDCAFLSPPPIRSYSMTVTFLNGSTTLGTVNRSVTYNSAELFAASTAPTKITRVVIVSPTVAGGFGIGQLRFGQTLIGAPIVTASVPALGLPEFAALALLLAAAGALLARRATLEG